MQDNPYEAPNNPVTSSKGVTEPGPLKTLISVVEIIIGATGVILYLVVAFRQPIAIIIMLPFLAITLLPLWSGVLLWRNNRYAWLPISIIAVPINLIMGYACVSEFFRLRRISKPDPLKEAIQNPHTIDPKVLAGIAAFSLLLLACAIYSFVIRNSMPQTDNAIANPDIKV